MNKHVELNTQVYYCFNLKPTNPSLKEYKQALSNEKFLKSNEKRGLKKMRWYRSEPSFQLSRPKILALYMTTLSL